MSVSDKKHEAKVGKQQMDLNSKYSKGGIPITTSGFLSMVSEWMMNQAINQTPFQTTTVPSCTYDLDQPNKESSKRSITTKAKDLVLPSREEIVYCGRKQLVNKKDLILFKLVLDFFEATMDSTSQKSDVLVPCSLRFYKHLTAEDVGHVLKQMQDINDRLAPKLAIVEPDAVMAFASMFPARSRDANL